MFRRASRICWVGTWRRFSHLRLPLKCPNWISSVSMAPKRVSKLKLAISSRLTPISLRQSSKRPTQSLKVPIFATLPGINSQICGATGVPARPVIARARTPVPPRSRLLCLKFRRPFLHVRRQTFFGIFALEEQLLVFAFYGQRGLHWNLPASLHRTFDAPHSFRGFVGRTELARVLHDVFHEAIALVDVVDDSEFERLFERESVAGDHQLDGFALAYQSRQALRAAGAGEYA